MKLDIEQTNALERVHKAFTEFNDAARALKTKGFSVTVTKADADGFFPFEIGRITYKHNVTMQDIEQGIKDRKAFNDSKDRPAPSTNGSTQAVPPQRLSSKGCSFPGCVANALVGSNVCPGHTVRHTDEGSLASKRSDLCSHGPCTALKVKGMTTCELHVGHAEE